MENDRRLRRLRFGGYLSITILGLTAATTFAATNTALATPLHALVTAVACATSSAACVSGANTGTAPGVSGSSYNGSGVTGASKTLYGVRASSISNEAVFGSSVSGIAGVAGTTPSNYGVFGYTSGPTGGIGVAGSSVSGYGVYGTATNGSGYGLVGVESAGGVGVYGSSYSGYGLQAVTTNGYGLVASAFGTGTGGYFGAAGTGYGIRVTGGEPAIYASSNNGNGSDIQGSYIGLLGRAPASNGFPLTLTDLSGNDLFYVDGVGDVFYHGSLNSFSRTTSGATVRSYSAKLTLPTVEDTGTAQLSGGVAAVRLDPTFAASIDANSSYRVFVTPNGDTRGLFVATKTPAGFIVRESQGGRSSVSFDYRIVATALGQAHQRMAPIASGSTVFPRAALPAAAKLPTVRQLPLKPALSAH